MNRSATGTARRVSFFLTLPVMMIMVAIVLFPVFDTLRLSFFDASFIKPGLSAPFIWLQNYLEVISGQLFWQSLWITLKWTIVSIILQFALGFSLALLVNSKIYGRNFVRSLFLIPWMLPGALAALMWKWMYHGSIGLLNYILLNLRLISDVHPWLSDPATVLWAAVLVNVWRGAPFFMIMMLGGLQTIPKDLYEAAKIDGANAVRTFASITVPLLKPLISTLLIYGTVGAFNFLDIILVLTRGGPANHTMVLPLYSWLSAFTDNRIGIAATISVLICLVLVLFGIAVSLIKSAKRYKYSAR
ncbi:carbohydrate ABC transporter membrane protein 1 (CUT1 family) [Hydrogenispora ethanolica]|uniref:Carbohydrate ABC transporter membrane protein 1 (CUT1 family) n=1 Tax=Hydrogenispora ethanolica TaxID=1082276 RepID=A0A4R1SAD4_HYDET|nr:sugar ABC transporter permease [Hydrogenispora ethanolica]TCL76473.1 carbohydrate ABC transporter membrane protein 1 (CUT1 family) [Hydrogenispora ethanolica]